MRVVSATIFKDEYENLNRMLAALPGKVDAAVVVGTEVNPPGPMKSPVKLVTGHYPWTDDFSSAKNSALAIAKGIKADFTIVIDSDEALQEDTPGALRAACASVGNAPGFGIDVCNVSPEGVVNHVSRQWRVLRNASGVQYTGIVHEQPTMPGGVGAEIPWIPGIRLLHYGYQDENLLFGPKKRRNMRLFRKALVGERDNAGIWFQLGAQLIMNGRPKRAVPCLEEALELWRASGGDVRLGHVRPMHYRLMQAYVMSGQAKSALSFYQEVPNEVICGDMMFWLGWASLHMGRPADAEHYLNMARKIPGDDLEMCSWRPLTLIAGAYEAMGQFDKAFDILKHVHDTYARNNDPMVILGMAANSQHAGKVDRAKSWCEVITGGTFPEQWKEKARMLLEAA